MQDIFESLIDSVNREIENAQNEINEKLERVQCSLNAIKELAKEIEKYDSEIAHNLNSLAEDIEWNMS